MNLPTLARPAMAAGFSRTDRIAHPVTSASNILNSAGVFNLHRFDVLLAILPVDFAPEPLLRLEIGGTSGAFLFNGGCMNEFALEEPRWPNGPAICEVANLPAFETEPELQKFHLATGPSCKVLRVWHCEHCEGWHMETTAPDPAGGSSGTGRSSKGTKKK